MPWPLRRKHGSGTWGICADQNPQRRAWNTYTGLQPHNTFVGNISEQESQGPSRKINIYREIPGPFPPSSLVQAVQVHRRSSDPVARTNGETCKRGVGSSVSHWLVQLKSWPKNNRRGMIGDGIGPGIFLYIFPLLKAERYPESMRRLITYWHTLGTCATNIRNICVEGLRKKHAQNTFVKE